MIPGPICLRQGLTCVSMPLARIMTWTRIAHGDPVMGLISQTEGTGFSMRVPTGKATLSMASATTADGNAISLGAGLPFGEHHSVTVSLGHAQETDSLLGAKPMVPLPV